MAPIPISVAEATAPFSWRWANYISNKDVRFAFVFPALRTLVCFLRVIVNPKKMREDLWCFWVSQSRSLPAGGTDVERGKRRAFFRSIKNKKSSKDVWCYGQCSCEEALLELHLSPTFLGGKARVAANVGPVYRSTPCFQSSSSRMVSKNLPAGIKIVIGQWNIDIWWVSQGERIFVILVLLYGVDTIENHNDIKALLSRNEGSCMVHIPKWHQKQKYRQTSMPYWC